MIGRNDERDIFHGGDSDDYLNGLSGNDVFYGGAGADTIIGGDGDDRADYSNSDSGVAIRLWNGTGLGGHAEGDSLTSIERVIGSQFADLLVGRNGLRDTLIGGDGDDFIYGIGGNDLLTGGAGADNIDGGEGHDLVSYAGSDVGVDVFLSTGLAYNGHAQGDVLTNIEGIVGSDYDDELYGRSGANDSFIGGLGDDSFIGFSGDDLFTGGGGCRQY